MDENNSFQVETSEDLRQILRALREFSQNLEFSKLKSTKLLTIASELTRNILNHADSGEVTLSKTTSSGRAGVYMLFEDNGPGIDNVELALEDGKKSPDSRGLGKGLGGSRNLADEFAIETTTGEGTTIEVTVWSS